MPLFQENFLKSEARYPALIAGIGTGKTMMLLFKIWLFCKTHPNSLALIVRKEYTDLRDSTLKDFERYFHQKIDGNKEYHFENGSAIMFRHASELNVLRNINLSIFGIEQAEEFETEEAFTFLRDRLRRDNAPYRQGCIIANARGHNWVWKMWINNPASEEFYAQTASTFENAENLPKDFIDDLKRMEHESPNHYRQFVLNSFEDLEEDDLLFNYDELKKATEVEFLSVGTKQRVSGNDIARYGEDKNVVTIIENSGPDRWEQTYIEDWANHDLMFTCGKILDINKQFKIFKPVIDGDGMGAGVIDRLRELKNAPIEFRGGHKAKREDLYVNKRTEGYMILKEKIQQGRLKLLNDEKLLDELMTIRFRFLSNHKKMILSKEHMKKDGLKSPDRADALMMAICEADRTQNVNINKPLLKRHAIDSMQNDFSRRRNLPRHAITGGR